MSSDVSINVKRLNIINFVVTNARSLSAKTNSVVENFQELDLHLMTISETWLKSGRKGNFNEVRQSLHDNSLGIINRNRDSRGGGVAIVYDKAKVMLKEAYNLPKNFEVVCGVGKWIESGDKLVVFSIYVPPKSDVNHITGLKDELQKKIDLIMSDIGDCVIIVAGDLNKRDISDCFVDHPSIRKVDTASTRGNATLDICFSNLHENIVESKICAPLENDVGTESDHKVCFYSAGKDKLHVYKTKIFKSRKYNVENEAIFGQRLAALTWNHLDSMSPTEAVKSFNGAILDILDPLFPEVEHKIRACDKPWITKRIKRLIRRKRRAFKYSGKNNYWKMKRDEADREILENKKRFLSKTKEEMKRSKNPKEYYRAVKLLQSGEASGKWCISNMFPNESEAVIADKAAGFFNKISQEFTPIEPPARGQNEVGSVTRPPPTCEQIIKRIREMKKPKSQVDGDIDRRLVSKFAHLLALPLSKIFAAVFRHMEWPEQWKTETVRLLPKTKSPNSLAQLRNISCTPFYSKLLETFLLDNLREKITLSSRQYGGKKGQGTDHMLIEIWDEIHKSLEDPEAAVNLMAIDFEKAFNRMDHGACLAALRGLGADESDVLLVNAFLHDRKMFVKINEARSEALTVPGGAPQGSILGCFLFCATIEHLLSTNPEIPGPHGLNDDTLGASSDSPSDSEGTESDEEGLAFFRWFRPRVINDTIHSYLPDQNQLADFGDLAWEPKPPVVKGYIDDLNVVEKIHEAGAVTHHTTGKTKARIHAPASQAAFEDIHTKAGEIDMKVNPDKTQMLCISSATTKESTSYVNYGDSRINSGNSLKILGFHFDDKPSVGFHVRKMVSKARDRLWSLRVLKRSGLDENDLLHIYKVFIRPILDYAIPTYHSQLTLEMSADIERVQASAMKIIYGHLVSYNTVLEYEKIEEHRIRRENIMKKFAIKTAANENFKNKWFPENTEVDYGLRARKKYEEKFSRTQRYYASPIQHMRRLLNNQ